MTLTGPAPPAIVPKPHGDGVMYAKRKNNPSTYMVQVQKRQLAPWQYNTYNNYLTAPKNSFIINLRLQCNHYHLNTCDYWRILFLHNSTVPIHKPLLLGVS